MATPAQMLARAAELERIAAALRIAAAEMNGHATTTKRAALPKALDAAVALRKQQTNGDAPAESAPDREQLIRDFIRDTPRTRPEIGAHLRAHGVALQDGATYQWMREHVPDLRMIGSRGHARWTLKRPRKIRQAAE